MAFLVGACGRVGFQGLESGVCGGHPARKTVTVHPPAIAEDELEFPLAIVLADSDLVGHTSTIAFCDESGAPLQHELEVADDVTGELVAWVLLPRLPADRELSIGLYYGDADFSSVQDRKAVWNGYRAVWHLADLTAIAADATGEHPAEIAGPMRAAGRVGPAFNFDGIDDRIIVGDPPDGSLDFDASESFTFSAWVKVAAATGTWQDVMWKGGSAPEVAGYSLETSSDATGIFSCMHDGAAPTPQRCVYAASIVFGDWVHLASVVDRSTGRLTTLRNGIEFGSADVTGVDTRTSEPLVIGAIIDQFELSGVIDEVRIAARAVSRSRLALEFANQATPSGFYSVGAVELVEP